MTRLVGIVTRWPRDERDELNLRAEERGISTADLIRDAVRQSLVERRVEDARFAEAAARGRAAARALEKRAKKAEVAI